VQNDSFGVLAPADTHFAQTQLTISADAPDGHTVQLTFETDYLLDGAPPPRPTPISS
jgi:hypothetical protein